MIDSVKRIITLTGRNIKEILRDPLSVVFTVGLPFLMEILFYFIFHNLTSQFEMKYLAPGIVVFAQSFLTLYAGILISTDRNTSFLTRLFVSKARPFEFIFGYTFALLPIAVIQAVLFFVVGGIIEPSFFSVGMIYGTLGGVITSMLFIGFGILFGSLCGEKSVGGVSSAIIMGQSVLSGMWFPIEGLSGGFLTVMRILPFKNATMTVQNLTTGYIDLFNDVFLPMIIVVAYTVLVFTAAVIVFRAKMKKN